MPDGKRKSSNNTEVSASEGLVGETKGFRNGELLRGTTISTTPHDDEDDIYFTDTEHFIKRVSYLNSNYLFSKFFQDSIMESKESLSDDLVILSVILNKKQKNDEVALAIDRLQRNGVNCILYTMNEIRGKANFDNFKNGFKSSFFSPTPADSTSDINENSKVVKNKTLNGLIKAFPKKKKRRRKKIYYGKPKTRIKHPPSHLTFKNGPESKESKNHLGSEVIIVSSDSNSTTQNLNGAGTGTASKIVKNFCDLNVKNVTESESIGNDLIRIEKSVHGSKTIVEPLNSKEKLDLGSNLPNLPHLEINNETSSSLTKMQESLIISNSNNDHLLNLTHFNKLKTSSNSEKVDKIDAKTSFISLSIDSSNCDSLEKSHELALNNDSVLVDENKKLGAMVEKSEELAQNQEKDLVIENNGEKLEALAKDQEHVLCKENEAKESGVLDKSEELALNQDQALVSENKSLKEIKNKGILDKEKSDVISDAIINQNLLPDSLPIDSMTLRRSSFYTLVSKNVRNNLDNYLDGRYTLSSSKRRKPKMKNGFLLHHGDNYPEEPETAYKLNLDTQILLKLNRRSKGFKVKEEKGKSIFSYLKLLPKRTGRSSKLLKVEEEGSGEKSEASFSGEWTLRRKYVCGVCAFVAPTFMEMVTHKGEEHAGIVVTHVELPFDHSLPPSLIRLISTKDSSSPNSPNNSTSNSPTKSNEEEEGSETQSDNMLPPCTKCSASFSNLGELHRHIFECAGNTAWLQDQEVKKTKTKRKRGVKRRLSNTPKKQKKVESPVVGVKKLRESVSLKCEFCPKEFKTEGWLRNHLLTHTLLVSIPLHKLTSLPVRASSSYRKSKLLF